MSGNVSNRDLIQALLDPDSSERMYAVSELIYGIENYTRATSLMLSGLAQLSAAKNDDEITRELYATKRAVDDINILLERYWLALRIEHDKAKKLVGEVTATTVPVVVH